jgi:hypothetical protein
MPCFPSPFFFFFFFCISFEDVVRNRAYVASDIYKLENVLEETIFVPIVFSLVRKSR